MGTSFLDELFLKLQSVKENIQNGVSSLVSISSNMADESVDGIIRECNIDLVRLRGLNREIFEADEKMKASLEEKKVPLSHLYLKLNSLLYEKNQYLRSIKASNNFKSKHPDIEIVSEMDFLATAPEEFTGTLNGPEDPHKLMLQRLHHEVFQRRSLVERKKELEQGKRKIEESIGSKKQYISELKKCLKEIKSTSKPIRELLSSHKVSLTRNVEVNPLASNLPSQLYNVYSHLIYLKECLNFNVSVEILKSEESAEVTGEAERSSKRRKHGEDSSSEIPLVHPMKLLLVIRKTTKVEAESLKLLFEFVPKLGLVFVSLVEGALVDLDVLFPEKTKTDGKEDKKNAMSIDLNFKGKAFTWAQKLASTEFKSSDLAEASKAVKELATALSSLGDVILPKLS